MTFEELFIKIRKRSGNRLTASIFLNDLMEEIDRMNPLGWKRREIKSGDLQPLKDIMEYSFMMSCACLEDTDDDPVYGEASEVAAVFCRIIKEQFDIDFVPPRILSPSEAMAQAGFVNIVKGKDGRKYVKLSPKGEAMAQETERQLKRDNN